MNQTNKKKNVKGIIMIMASIILWVCTILYIPAYTRVDQNGEMQNYWPTIVTWFVTILCILSFYWGIKKLISKSN